MEYLKIALTSAEINCQINHKNHQQIVLLLPSTNIRSKKNWLLFTLKSTLILLYDTVLNNYICALDMFPRQNMLTENKIQFKKVLNSTFNHLS